MDFLSYPYQISDAATNMALDLSLLEAGPADCIRFRHYGWKRPSWTFGYTQRWQQIEADRPEVIAECVRRPTGGGIVDHQADFTYCLVVPNRHPWWREKVCDVYSSLHRVIAGAIAGEGRSVRLFNCGETRPAASTDSADACFQRPAVSDVLDLQTGQKLAGAALKRNRSGLLVQGSILARAIVDSPRFAQTLEAELTQTLQAHLKSIPTLPQPTAACSQQFQSPAWNRKR